MLPHSGWTWLTLMPLLLSLSTGELSFYRDTLSSDDITLKQLARYLETHGLRRSDLPWLLSLVHKKHTLQHDDQKERNLLKFLTEKAEGKLLRQSKLKTLDPYALNNYNGWINQELEYVPPFYDLDLKLRYPEEKLNKGHQSNKDFEDLSTSFDEDRDIVEEFMDFYKKHMHDHVGMSHEGERKSMQAINIPDFTYEFDDSHPKDEHPFAVKPNDPRYYSHAPFSSVRQHVAEMTPEKKEELAVQRTLLKHVNDMQIFNHKMPKDIIAIDSLEERRITGQRPLIVPVEQDLNNDIYFIAIVAGCSAAAMFALVLISLTWCRLQRGAKAAADIEYPAYGITGPNKDVSPSGDQRLAQSAQMYHFQHQKQQIIAMENRASATRDPGSLSEADSDEENEEGDYTVYECPGLASTGEMEVKNPMFHDDPTPATPAQSNNKEEDHI